MAVRAAIGARPGQLVAQVLTECALLGLLGAALGLMLAWILLPVSVLVCSCTASGGCSTLTWDLRAAASSPWRCSS